MTGTVEIDSHASLNEDGVPGSTNPQSAPTSASLSVSGAGTTAGQLAVSPTSLVFGNVTIGSAQNQRVTVTNSGGTTATISQAVAAGAGRMFGSSDGGNRALMVGANIVG